VPANKYARVERERRYLVCNLPESFVSEREFLRISDLYISGTRLRLRRIEDKNGQVVSRKLGQKFLPQPSVAEATMMTNFYLDEAEYKTLAVLAGTRIVKRRYPFVHEERRFSVDVFEGALAGLILCESELLDEEKSALKLPPFVSHEVTSDLFFTGGSLAKIPQQELTERLRHECKS
jgi:CYTH domain-containing protein